MVYQNKFVCAIKVNGAVLREQNNFVTLPFGCEYSILLKNLNTVRAMARVSVDGTEATEGTWLVVAPYASIDLERSIRNGNISSGNKFKFIEKTGAVEAHRGNKEDDGLVRIEYKWEKVVERPQYVNFYPQDWNGFGERRRNPCEQGGRRHSMRRGLDKGFGGGSARGGSAGSVGGMDSAERSILRSAAASGELKMMAMNCAVTPTSSANDAGITVAGSQSNQQFTWASSFPTVEPSEVIVIQLRGEVAGHIVTRPVTVNVKPICSSCGKANDSRMQFCGDCGTALRYF